MKRQCIFVPDPTISSARKGTLPICVAVDQKHDCIRATVRALIERDVMCSLIFFSNTFKKTKTTKTPTAGNIQQM